MAAFTPRPSDAPIRADAGSVREAAAARGGYKPPRLVRVRVATAILNSGRQTAETHCTQHWHTTNIDCANP